MQETVVERRVELALQGYRLDDLMRWAADKVIVGKRGRGAYLGHDGILYKSFAEDKKEALAKSTGRWLTDGWILCKN